MDDPDKTQLTPGVRHYGLATSAAAAHVATMLQHPEEWDTLTGLDRACIAELLEIYLRADRARINAKK